MKEATVYIDESGDLGHNRGTRWFVMTAVVVDKNKEYEIRTIIDSIKHKLNTNEIHMRKISDHFTRTYIVKSLSQGDFTCINVLADTTKLNLSETATDNIAYNYIGRLLIERVSWYLRDSQRIGDIVFSSRGSKRDGLLIEYIKNMAKSESTRIEPSVIRNITYKKSNEWDMLQLADVCATSMYLSHTVGRYGMRVPCYAYFLSSHLYSRSGKIVSYGIKYFNDSMFPDKEEFAGSSICIKKEKTSLATLPHT